MANDWINFDEVFAKLTGNSPFPWQKELYRRFANGDLPSSCNLPTGLGKTSVIAIWLLARDVRPSLPRRLVYVVNRRTVVDQTTDEVERIRQNLANVGKAKNDLAISTLRGKFADNREWAADPSRAAVICGTVDMIGSRLLFSGYGVGFKGKPLHAGFLGQDSLIVHDEAHLEPAFQFLLIAIHREQCKSRLPDFKPMRVMELSATSRSKTSDKPFELTQSEKDATKDSPGVLGIVGKRLRAPKQLQLHTQSTSKLGEQLAKIAIDQFKDSGRAILIFTRTIDDVKAVVNALDKAKLPVAQLIGPMRGLERDKLVDDPIFQRFLPEPLESDRTVFLVCTSAGEVASCHHSLAIGTECRAVIDISVSQWRGDGLARDCVPNPRGIVPTCCNHSRPIRTKFGGMNRAFVPQRRPDRLAGNCIPHLRRIVVACCNHSRAVRTEQGGINPTGVLQRQSDGLASGNTPDERRALTAHRKHLRALRAELGGIQVARMD
jgi:hypothetical protein